MISGKTRLAAVIANPIKHSLSPFIHNLAFEQTGEDGVYLAFEINETSFEGSLQTIRQWYMYGANLSMPYKQLALPYMDQLSEEVEFLGALNTIVNRNGQLTGYNTDGIGFIESLKYKQIKLRNQRVFILGAGGAAMAIIYALAKEGVATLTVAKRQNETFEFVKNKLHEISHKTGMTIELVTFDEKALISRCETATMIVNTTNVGMIQSESLLRKEWLSDNQLVVDIIYQPLETQLLIEAKEKGCQTMNGIGMLLFQALASFELWTGKRVTPEPIFQQLMDLIEEKNNQ
ncbi:shikimate dehydrogenase [Vagococcus xieshaowenii]|uniref:Shikimate dehydrogenase (NADP(+)) n=1 Tax=Vagococcus xieshaowenii TaxID=2562451 RepID=A0AAJ5EFE3_9ENTE|nr:shikimate dehydrogenase [Vagococcus xieshaowenii]QCA28465.1 shikimate dehydrogenase [Vagococcus xieshaowenii]TFZ42780.1 shikimate dehydrogenase [Vagococcus xieshaowenii]